LPQAVIKVAIVEDQLEIRESLRILIDGTTGLRAAGTFRTMEEAIRGIVLDVPDVALVDIGLPGMSGIDGIRELKICCPSVLPLMLTVYQDDERIFAALCAGARGYLLKNTPPARLLDSLRDAVAGGAPISPEIARRVIALFQKIHPPARVDYDLTPHELRILKLLVDGENYKTAAMQLCVSVNTIAFHIRHIYEKLQVHSKSEAVSKALRDGIV
jgi:DNA-binding NarL/FixJ family response regulator